MSKLHDDLINDILPGSTVEESIDNAMKAIADRIEGCHGNLVRLGDLCSILREDTAAVARAVVANTPSQPKVQVQGTGDAPLSTFDKPRTDVRPGMVDPNDHRDQVSPPNENTEAERAQIQMEQKAKAEGKQPVVVEQALPPASTLASQQPVTFKDDKAKAPA